MPTNKIYASFRENVYPYLRGQGFVMRPPWDAYRIRGELVDCISIQKSRWGWGFYIHYFTKLLSSPFGDPTNGYNVGHRMQPAPDVVPWDAETEQDATLAMQDVLQRLQTEALPWFERIRGACEFAELIDEEELHAFVDEQYVLAQAICGDKERAMSASSMSKSKILADGQLSKNDAAAFLRVLEEVEDAIECHTLEEYVAGKRAENMAKAKLKPSAVQKRLR